jgi:hypothetical protein
LFLLSIVATIPFSQALNVGMDTKLATSKASFHGEGPGDGAGMSVDIVGDVNGDGYADMAIGAPSNHDIGTHSGKAYLVFGNSTGLTMNMNLSKANASFRGEGTWDEAGNIVAGAGDVNGDGYGDLLIAAHYHSEGGLSARGEVYLIFGKPSGWTLNMSLANADASFLGETKSDYAGKSVDGAGDVNGDGFDDIIIGAPYNDGSAADAGQAYIIFGKASGWAKDVNLSSADASYQGKAAGDWAGDTVSGAGDLNGDHYDDILIGAFGNDDGKADGGTTYVVFGKPSGWAIDTKLTNANINASYYAESDYDYAATALNGAGDVNGDGYDDFLVGAKYRDEGTFETGQAYLILGKNSGWTTGVSLGTVDASYRGEGFLDWAGYYVNGAGDVNGDGIDDFLIDSEGNAAGGGQYAGQAYLILGKKAGWAQDTILSSADASWWGEAANYGLGYSLSGGGDVNGDGYDDVLLGEPGNPGGGIASGAGFLVIPDKNTHPATITSVTAYSDAGYTKTAQYAKVNDTVYVQLVGAGGGNATRKDMVVVTVSSNESAKMGIRLKLMETGVATGSFQGNFTIRDRTHGDYDWIAATGGENLTVRSVDDGTKSASLYVAGQMIRPALDKTNAIEDLMYDVHYSGLGWIDEAWTFHSNTSWLSWNATSHDIQGLPDNWDVGQFWARINVSYAGGALTDEHFFNVKVQNVPPTISTANIVTATEDQEYRVDYNSSDEGQGTVTWHLKTNATGWLAMDPLTGVLNGTPSNSAVGKVRMNISVDDGNGGWAYSNFTLTVKNANDPPRIDSTNNLTAIEDAPYNVQYLVKDIDVGDTHTWGLQTNASGWLSLDAKSGILSGTPGNDDVGWYWVNVTVKDAAGTSDSTNFTLTVVNVNDLPEITSQPVVGATVYAKYEYQVVAKDVDKGDMLTYSLDTAPNGMTVDGATGLVKWVPAPGQKGDNQVEIKVADLVGSVTQAFTISVIDPSSWPPVTTLLAPEDGTTVQLSTPLLKWKWDDKDSTDVAFDVYLGTDSTKVTALDQSVRIASGVKNASLPVIGPLTLGARYYWTVIGNDGKNTGLCINGVWSFIISSSAKANHAPTITSIPSKEAFVGVAYRYQVVATDVDGDMLGMLAFQLALGPSGMNIDASTGLVTWMPAAAQLGPTTIKVAVSDGILTAEQAFVLTVSKPNHPPTITAITDQPAKVGKAFSYQVLGTDLDGDKLNYSLKERPDGMTISDTGLIVWTPSKGQTGAQTVIVAVSDGKNQTTITFKVDVKKADTVNGLSGMLLPIILVVVIVVVAVVAVAVMLRRKGKGPAQAPVQQANVQQSQAVPPPQTAQPPPAYQPPGQYYPSQPSTEQAQQQYPPQDGTYQYPNQPYNQQPPPG